MVTVFKLSLVERHSQLKRVLSAYEDLMIKFETEFTNYLVNRRNAVTLDTARSYISYLKRVDKQLFGIDFHTDIKCLDDIKNLVFGLRATGMPDRSISNCDVAMRAYLKFLNTVIYTEKLFPEESSIHIEGHR